MELHSLKWITLILVGISLLLLGIGFSVDEYFAGQSIWRMHHAPYLYEFCKPYDIPDTEVSATSTSYCLFPFVYEGKVYHDCAMDKSRLWCPSGCKPNGEQKGYNYCTRTLGSYTHGLQPFLTGENEKRDFISGIQITCSVATILALISFLLLIGEMTSSKLRYQPLMQYSSGLFLILSVILLLISVSMAASRTDENNSLDWGYWLFIAALILLILAMLIYFVAMKTDLRRLPALVKLEKPHYPPAKLFNPQMNLAYEPDQKHEKVNWREPPAVVVNKQEKVELQQQAAMPRAPLEEIYTIESAPQQFHERAPKPPREEDIYYNVHVEPQHLNETRPTINRIQVHPQELNISPPVDYNQQFIKPVQLHWIPHAEYVKPTTSAPLTVSPTAPRPSAGNRKRRYYVDAYSGHPLTPRSRKTEGPLEVKELAPHQPGQGKRPVTHGESYYTNVMQHGYRHKSR